MLLSLIQRGHSVNFMFSPSHCGIPRNEAADDEAMIARSLPQEGTQSGTWTSSLQSGDRTGGCPKEKKGAYTAWQAPVGVAGTVFLVLSRKSCPEWRLCAQARCDSCPLLDMPARALRIKSNLLCRWCRPFLTELSGPPLPPPEPPPDVSTAKPCRPASGGLRFSCPTCGSVRSSVHNMRAHARRAQPGVPIF
ncbi:hypothetical protein C4B63_3g721 [Trypanosoma cruzi]|uniref:Uncharacterized protein n=1 Tax=Trypanosoma cruzi TaxID=5693 RepID=A0A2V2W0W6_TRYCR|nr:hypothetical protein C4B63_3g721 [Trypanosoma cruzi]